MQIKHETKATADVDDFIDAVVEISNMSFDQVETALFDCNLYPEGFESCIGITTMSLDKVEWFKEATLKALKNTGLDRIYISE